MGGYVVAVVFWIFVGTTAVTGMVLEHKKKRLGVELLRAAVERGQQLDADMVQKVLAQEQQHDEGFDPLALRLGGIITIASAIGAMILAVFVSQVYPDTLYLILGAGCLGLCVGVGLLISARMVARTNAASRSP